MYSIFALETMTFLSIFDLDFACIKITSNNFC